MGASTMWHGFCATLALSCSGLVHPVAFFSTAPSGCAHCFLIDACRTLWQQNLRGRIRGTLRMGGSPTATIPKDRRLFRIYLGRGETVIQGWIYLVPSPGRMGANV